MAYSQRKGLLGKGSPMQYDGAEVAKKTSNNQSKYRVCINSNRPWEIGVQIKGMVLELGMHCGYTSIRILRLLSTSGKLLTVEVDPLTAEKGEEILLVAGFNNSQVLPCSSAEAISKLASHPSEDHLDLVVIDHDPEQIFWPLRKKICFPSAAVEAGALVMLEYLTSKPHIYTVCQIVKDMLEIHCHTDTHLHREES
ncbi:transmembrane O-methyltransferase [Silurus meridionalis]|nr:transmembrane O-methyltransferase [Silurus meridionalis]